MRPARSLSLVTSLLLSACASGRGDGDGGEGTGAEAAEVGGDPPIEATLESIQENVFSAVCTNCHVGAAAPQGLRLEEGMSHAMLVNVPSTEVPSILRVNPGNPDDSYLIQKIEGTASVGEQMPLGGPELSAEQIAAIRQWITDGAIETTATRSRVAAAQLRLLNPVPEADIRPADAPPVSGTPGRRGSGARRDLAQREYRHVVGERWRRTVRRRQRSGNCAPGRRDAARPVGFPPDTVAASCRGPLPAASFRIRATRRRRSRGQGRSTAMATAVRVRTS